MLDCILKLHFTVEYFTCTGCTLKLFFYCFGGILATDSHGHTDRYDDGM